MGELHKISIWEDFGTIYLAWRVSIEVFSEILWKNPTHPTPEPVTPSRGGGGKQKDKSGFVFPEPSLWNSPLGRRAFLKKTGAATVGTAIVFHGFPTEILASMSFPGGQDLVIKETGVISTAGRTFTVTVDARSEAQATAEAERQLLTELQTTGEATSVHQTTKYYGPGSWVLARTAFSLKNSSGGQQAYTSSYAYSQISVTPPLFRTIITVEIPATSVEYTITYGYSKL